MNRLQKERLYYIFIIALAAILIVSLVLYSLKQNINVFVSPSEITSSLKDSGNHFRLGGVVQVGSVRHAETGLQTTFIVTDFKKSLLVTYDGVLPDLFREGKGVIAEGKFNQQGHFVAARVLAKHDENYMPKNIALSMHQPQGK